MTNQIPPRSVFEPVSEQEYAKLKPPAAEVVRAALEEGAKARKAAESETPQPTVTSRARFR